MTPEKWQEIKEMAREKFNVLEKGEENLEPGKMEWFVFEGPTGRIRLEFYQRPKVIDRKMIIAKRIGASGKEELIYGDEEVCYLKAYRWQDNEWKEFEYQT